jgi:hypothetical protein
VATNHGVGGSNPSRPSMKPKTKKRKTDIDFIIEEMSNGCTVYLNERDEVGVCGFCNELSYKDHQPDCPVKIAQDIIEERL